MKICRTLAVVAAVCHGGRRRHKGVDRTTCTKSDPIWGTRLLLGRAAYPPQSRRANHPPNVHVETHSLFTASTTRLHHNAREATSAQKRTKRAPHQTCKHKQHYSTRPLLEQTSPARSQNELSVCQKGSERDSDLSSSHVTTTER